MRSVLRKRVLFQGIFAGILALSVSVAQDEAGTRGIKSPAMPQQKRAERVRQQVAVKGNTKGAKAAGVSPADPILGMNVWHMQLAAAASPVTSRGLEHRVLDPTGTRDWIPERMTLEDPVREGELVRLSFESASPGYLYIIDRDVFRDGTKGPATLRFPTKMIRGGDNVVMPGVPVQIPNPTDNPSAFTVTLKRNDQTGIQLILILTPARLPEIQVPEVSAPVSEALLARYERELGPGVRLVEDKSMMKMVATLAEAAAASDPARPLDDRDPLPIMLFHRTGSPGKAMLATAVIKIQR